MIFVSKLEILKLGSLQITSNIYIYICIKPPEYHLLFYKLFSDHQQTNRSDSSIHFTIVLQEGLYIKSENKFVLKLSIV